MDSNNEPKFQYQQVLDEIFETRYLLSSSLLKMKRLFQPLLEGFCYGQTKRNNIDELNFCLTALHINITPNE